MSPFSLFLYVSAVGLGLGVFAFFFGASLIFMDWLHDKLKGTK